MDQTMIEVLKLVVMAVVCLIAIIVHRDLVPFIQSKMTQEQLKTAQDMAKVFVYMAQQIYGDKTGKQRKEIAKKALIDALNEAGIYLSDQFVDDMIEAAVKGLRIAENSGKEG